MKYVVMHKQEEVKLSNFNVQIDGLDVSPVNRVKGLTIKASKVTIVDEELRREYIKLRVNKKIDKIIKFMLRIINDEDTNPDDTAMVLDEINRLKGIVVNKYKEYLTKSEYKSLLTKLIIIEEEFKKNYNQRMYNNYGTSYYIEEITNRRGR